jgi:hypothetical protein
VGENRPQECFSALFMLKQQLAQYKISTPRFDFAAVTYLHKLGFDLDRRLPELFPRGELAVALDLADALLPVQVMQVAKSVRGGGPAAGRYVHPPPHAAAAPGRAWQLSSGGRFLAALVLPAL